MWLAFIDMEHPIQVFKLINGILWLDGIKYRRVAGFNKKTRVQYWICSFDNKYKNTKCECRAFIKLVLKHGNEEEEIANLTEMIWNEMTPLKKQQKLKIVCLILHRKSEQFIEVLVYGDKLEKHANYHEV